MAVKIRLQFDFGPKAVQELDEFKNALGVSARVDVVKHALGLLQWAMQAKRDGWELLAERGKEHRIVVLPFAPGGNVIGIDRPVDTPGGKGQ